MREESMSLSIKRIGADEFWEHFYKKIDQRKIPFKASFELTYHCNLSCCHCYILQREKTTTGRNPEQKSEKLRGQNSGELSYKEVCTILDQLAKMGCFHLNLTGGEIFTRADIIRILEYAKKTGFYLVLLTNGTLITPTIADCLKDLNIDQIDVSLYGITERIHEAVTRVPGSLKRCLQGIGLLRKRKIPVTLKMTVMNPNIREFDDVKSFARKIKSRFQYGYLINPKINGSKEPLAFRLSPRQAIELERKNQPYLFEEEQRSKEEKQTSPKRGGLFYCSAGRNSLAITPYGELNLCLEYRLPVYDLRKGSLSEGWRELVNYVESAKPGKNYRCNNCRLQKFCQWCPAVGLLEEGDRGACSSYYRELAKIRRNRN
jgi:radical SAM protein with 4Fe4S-binding SPASM domain